MKHAYLLMLLLMVGCSSSKPGGFRINSDRFRVETEQAFYHARNKLISVGAPVRDLESVDIEVGYVPGTTPTRYGDGYNYEGNVIGGQTAGRWVKIAMSRNGTFQFRIAWMELGHSALIRGNEESHYEWFKKAGWWD